MIEAECPLCKVELRVHDERACCPFCGESNLVSSRRLEVRQCPEHGNLCDHWEAFWAGLLPQASGTLNYVSWPCGEQGRKGAQWRRASSSPEAVARLTQNSPHAWPSAPPLRSAVRCVHSRQ